MASFHAAAYIAGTPDEPAGGVVTPGDGTAEVGTAGVGGFVGSLRALATAMTSSLASPSSVGRNSMNSAIWRSMAGGAS